MRVSSLYAVLYCLACRDTVDGQSLQCNGAYDRDQLLRMVGAVGKLTPSQSRAIALVERCGVAVKWSEELSAALRDAGAGTPLRERIRELAIGESHDSRAAGLIVRNNNKDGQAYVWIPPGEFWMGCSDGDDECQEDEKPKHLVVLTRGYWLGRTEVTQEAWAKTGRVNPSRFQGPVLPVEQVSGTAASAYCQSIGGRLPTEAEWEYAARAGSRPSRYAPLHRIAWYSANSNSKTHPAGTTPANLWGLHDMLGNLWEWVADWYQSGYYRSPAQFINPRGPDSGTFQVLRGGSWHDDRFSIRVSYRNSDNPRVRRDVVGFRCVWDAPAP